MSRIQKTYDKNSVKSIFDFSLGLVGNSLAQCSELPIEVINQKNRGDLGRLVEIHYFRHSPPNNHEPDFSNAGLELKTTGTRDYVRPQKSGEVLRAKERLSLTSINYRTIVSETWESSTFLRKCNLMLVLFYKYDKSVRVIDQIFELSPLLILMFPSLLKQNTNEIEFIMNKALRISDDDLEIIKRDWEYIRGKIADNRAHELSEGDTFYLGASRKGSGGEDEPLKKQIGSEIGAKSRGLCFKQNFLTKIVQGHSKSEVSLGIGKEFSFEEAMTNCFSKYIGMTVQEISDEVGFQSKSKSIKWLLARRMLSKNGKSIEEFKKADIQLKTVSLTKNGSCREDMSFPAFRCMEIVEENWDDSDFSFQVESKFLFVVFRQDETGSDRLFKVMYWNMPYEDRLEAQKVWEDAKKRLLSDAHDLPKIKDSRVAHVRPHAKNSKDVDLTPQGDWVVKRCFWLNGSYIAEIVK